MRHFCGYLFPALLVSSLVLVTSSADASQEASPAATHISIHLGPAELVHVGDGSVLSVSPSGESVLVARSSDVTCFVSLHDHSAEVCQRQMPAEYGEPQWSADGSLVTFATDASIEDGRDSDIWIMERSSGSLRNLTDDTYSFAPEYESTPTCLICSPETPEDVRDELIRQLGPSLVDARFPPGTPVDITPIFTLDGSAVIFARSIAGEDHKLFETTLMVFSLSETEPRVLARVSHAPLATRFGMKALGDSEVAFSLTDLLFSPEGTKSGLWLFNTRSQELTLVREDDHEYLHTIRPLGKVGNVDVLVSFPLVVGHEEIARVCAFWVLDRTSSDLVPLRGEGGACPTAAFNLPNDGTVLLVFGDMLGVYHPTRGGVMVDGSTSVKSTMKQLVDQEWSSIPGWVSPTALTRDGYLCFSALSGELVRMPIAISPGQL